MKKVNAERDRQIAVEGWTLTHDDEHDEEEWAELISVYAFRGEWIKVAALAVAAQEAKDRANAS